VRFYQVSSEGREVRKMPFYEREGIIGYCVGEKVYCSECFEGLDQKVKFTDVVRDEQLEEYIIVCDKCGEEVG
jgi:hypothetical protein